MPSRFCCERRFGEEPAIQNPKPEIQNHPSHRSHAVWVCYAAMMCLAIAVNLAPIYLTTFSEAFASGGVVLSPEQMGLIPAVLFAGLVAGIVATGPLADRFGGKTFAGLGLGLVTAGLAATSRAPSYPMLLAAAFLMGLGAGVLDMVLSPIVAALEPERKTAALNWLHSFYCAGALVTTFAGTIAQELEVPWRAFAAAAAVAPAVVLVLVLRLRVPRLVEEGQQREPTGRMLASAFFVLALVAMACAGATEAGMAQWLPAFAERTMDFSKSAGAAALTGFLVAMWLGRVLAASLGHRVSSGALLAASAALSAALYVAGVYVPSRELALAACVATGLAVGTLWPTTLGLAAERIPRGGATMFGLLSAAGNAGCLAAPWLVGVVAERAGLRAGLVSCAVFPVLMIAALAAMRRAGRPQKEA